MKHLVKKWMAWSMVLLMLLLAFPACRIQTGEEQGTTGIDTAPDTTGEDAPSPVPGNEIELFRNGKCVYNLVVRSQKASSVELEAAKKVYQALREKSSDVLIDIEHRYNASAMEVVVAVSSEIYPEIAQLQKDMRYNDYAIAKCGNKLIITAPGETALAGAVNKFIRSITEALKPEVANYSISEVFYQGRYDLDTFTISGNALKDYTIVYPAGGSLHEAEAAVAWQSAIGLAYGYKLNVSDDSAAQSDLEILIGTTNRTESGNQSPGEMNYRLHVKNGKLLIQAGGMYSFQYAADEYFRLLKKEGQRSVELTENSVFSGTLLTAPVLDRTDTTDVRVMSANILAEFPNWNSFQKECPVEPRAEILVANIAFYRPDVVAIQECSANWAQELRGKLGSEYVMICNLFPNQSENYNALIYNRTTLELISSDVIRYSVSDNVKCRNMGIGVFRIKSTGKEFCMISTHWNLAQNVTPVQGDELAAKIQELSLSGTRPVLASGDFNCSSASAVYESLMNKNLLNNLRFSAQTLVNDVATCKPGVGMEATTDSGTIDYIFGTKDVTCSKFMTIVGNRTIDLSDHNGLLADVTFP